MRKKRDEKEVKKRRKSKKFSGLFIIGTERHESRRIDNH